MFTKNLILLVPASSLAASYTRWDGGVLDGDVSKGFDIVDSFHSPNDVRTININTKYGGGFGTGMTGDFGNYDGPEGAFFS
mmetsp:Transcript_13642/g.33439  ORF Transcript_13642/g.33439 Transcript_13642/m.33439 type:complete len:81 (-) Transcript_13642:202-444(-)|eukprot:CAMPEP_0206239268 /NCGR_PEP_ID=MMETSP0047_2-20121206/15283_1 /ASSEMBLY_ACC=CAM_ASM_000192 /TAXON_ID=195065 /ORGANISM="Chroomonas mesostigmatica_cf, Strain CCMP1168" /LENGTH=80 /DNA_ID=CAMNT_0053663909 /DNA_START=12 /DNA_END=254 /DNA_ORIENTATION=-